MLYNICMIVYIYDFCVLEVNCMVFLCGCCNLSSVVGHYWLAKLIAAYWFNKDFNIWEMFECAHVVFLSYIASQWCVFETSHNISSNKNHIVVVDIPYGMC
jgi:hypothetical protein